MAAPRGDARTLDVLADAATPATYRIDVGGDWVARLSPSLPFRRTNSVMTSGAAPDDVDAAVGRSEEIYDAHGAPSIFQISAASGPTDLDERLAARGYDRAPGADVLVANIADIARATRSEDGATTSDGVHDAWIARYATLHGDDPDARDRVEAHGRMLRTVPSVIVASLTRDEGTVALGFGVVDRGWIGVFGMGTVRSRRREGAATAVLHALVAAGADAGAVRAYLQAEPDNPAQQLYQRAGFEAHHRYHYRVGA